MSHSDDHDDDYDTVALLGALRDADAGDAAPVHVEAAVMKAWDESVFALRVPAVTSTFALRASVDKSRGRRPVFSHVGAVAAATLLAVGLTEIGGRLRSGTAVAPAVAGESTPTVILVGEPIRDGEQVRLVRMQIPVSTLHLLGVRSTAAVDAVDVDVVVGEDGVARALSLNP